MGGACGLRAVGQVVVLLEDDGVRGHRGAGAEVDHAADVPEVVPHEPLVPQGHRACPSLVPCDALEARAVPRLHVHEVPAVERPLPVRVERGGLRAVGEVCVAHQHVVLGVPYFEWQIKKIAGEFQTCAAVRRAVSVQVVPEAVFLVSVGAVHGRLREPAAGVAEPYGRAVGGGRPVSLDAGQVAVRVVLHEALCVRVARPGGAPDEVPRVSEPGEPVVRIGVDVLRASPLDSLRLGDVAGVQRAGPGGDWVLVSDRLRGSG